jgi:hypothetical protein
LQSPERLAAVIEVHEIRAARETIAYDRLLATRALREGVTLLWQNLDEWIAAPSSISGERDPLAAA